MKDVRDCILYEDKDILVCHKPAGIAVQSGRVGSMDLESLLKNYIAQKKPGKMPYLAVIHRLDQPVEGVLVFALNSKAAAALNRQMTAGEISKTYLAVTDVKKESVLQKENADTKEEEKVQMICLTDWLCKDNKTNSSSVVPAGTAGGKKAVLYYKILESREVQGQKRCMVQVRLETGRHHQIRVQLSHAGMPLVGDRKYNPAENSREALALCSVQLEFTHPASGKKMKFQVAPTGTAFREFSVKKM